MEKAKLLSNTIGCLHKVSKDDLEDCLTRMSRDDSIMQLAKAVDSTQSLDVRTELFHNSKAWEYFVRA